MAWFIGCIPDNGLLLTTFPSKLSYFNFELCTGIESLLSNPISPTIKMLNIVLNTTVNFNLPLSYVKNTSIGFYLSYKFKIPGSVFTIENDLTSQYKTSSLTLHCNNLFSLKYINANQLTIQQYSHPVEGYSFLSTLETSDLFYTQYDTTEIPFPDSIAHITSSKPIHMELGFSGGFSKPNSIIDLSNSTIQDIWITNAGPNFNLNGKIPIKYSMNTLQIVFMNGNLTEFFNFNNTYLNSITLSNNKYSIELPSISKYNIIKKVSIIISNNKFTGTVDRSWCNYDLSIANNVLSGELPSCFTCYYNSRKIYLTGNNFTNVSPPPPCTTVIPNLKYEKNELSLYGQDLGFDTSFTVVPSLIGSFTLKNYSSLFIYQVSNLQPTVYNITFTKISQTFTLSSHPINPKVNKVSINSNGQLVIDGSYFTYNASSVSITIGSISCTVRSATFYQMICSTTSIMQGLNESVLVISVGNLYVQVSLNENFPENSISMCQDNCLFNKNQGVCDMTGTCQCKYSEWVGTNCNTTAIKCTNQCLNNGECDFTKGVCKCQINYSGSICDIPVHYISGVNAIFESGGNVTIHGWFGFIHNGLNVLIGGQDCIVQNIDETTIQCVSMPGIGQVELVVQQNGLSARINFTFIKDKIQCSNTCVNGACDFDVGICSCESNFEGDDCSVPIHFITVVKESFESGGIVTIIGWFGSIHNNLSVLIGGYQCNIQSFNESAIKCISMPGSGQVELIVQQNGLSTNINYTFIKDEMICSCLNGNCNSNGQCTCNYGWTGRDCSIFIHYITSVSPSTISGGRVILEGSFGLVNGNLTVRIGNLECIIDSFNQSTIVCTVGSGTGVMSINVTQNGIVYIAKDKYHYMQLETNQERKCPNNCSGTNGICLENNICSCKDGWSGLDCSAIIDEETNTFVNLTDGSSTITNRETIFKISVISLNEVDFGGVTVESHPLNQWIIDSSNDTHNIHTFNQKLENNNATITYTIEEVKDNDKQLEFAGVSFIVNRGSIKITIKIDNYQYKSQLNTLDLLVESKVSDSNLDENDKDCNSSPSEISNQGDEDLYYIKIEKNSKVFFGRFISKMISNGKPTYLPSETFSNTPNSSIIALKLSHCDHCIIDPDFSVLLSADFDKTCDKSGIPSYIIALSTALPVVGVSTIIISIVFYKRHQRGKRLINLIKKFGTTK
ncbi:hypothetical protein ACTA71_009839 [Dictyostelium dimigraforme]